MYTGNPHQDRKGPLYEGGRWINPNFPNEQKSFNDSWLQLLNTGADQSMRGPLNPSGIQLAELSQKQMNYMQNPYMNPALGGISEEQLWNNVKGMDYIRPWYKPFGKPSQIPAERSEFDDYVNQLQRGKMGPKGPYWSS